MKWGEMPNSKANEHAKARQISVAKLVLILGALTAFNSMSIDMYLPAFPQIAKDLAVPLGTVHLSISAFLFGSATGQLLYGPVADRWGRKRPLLFGVGVYIISTVGCACVRSGEGLLFWRVVMALGGGASIVNLSSLAGRKGGHPGSLVYSTYLGGSGYDQGNGIAVDSSGNAYVTGYTFSSDFPASPDAFQVSTGDGVFSDAFVSIVNTSGNALSYSSCLGGGDFDLGYGIAVDSSGSAYAGLMVS